MLTVYEVALGRRRHVCSAEIPKSGVCLQERNAPFEGRRCINFQFSSGLQPMAAASVDLLNMRQVVISGALLALSSSN